MRVKTSHEVVEEVLIAVLVGVLLQVLLCHDIVVGMISPPCELLALLGYTGLLLTLHSVSFGFVPFFEATGRGMTDEYG